MAEKVPIEPANQGDWAQVLGAQGDPTAATIQGAIKSSYTDQMENNVGPGNTLPERGPIAATLFGHTRFRVGARIGYLHHRGDIQRNGGTYGGFVSGTPLERVAPAAGSIPGPFKSWTVSTARKTASLARSAGETDAAGDYVHNRASRIVRRAGAVALGISVPLVATPDAVRGARYAMLPSGREPLNFWSVATLNAGTKIGVRANEQDAYGDYVRGRERRVTLRAGAVALGALSMAVAVPDAFRATVLGLRRGKHNVSQGGAVWSARH